MLGALAWVFHVDLVLAGDALAAIEELVQDGVLGEDLVGVLGGRGGVAVALVLLAGARAGGGARVIGVVVGVGEVGVVEHAALVVPLSPGPALAGEEEA